MHQEWVSIIHLIYDTSTLQKGKMDGCAPIEDSIKLNLTENDLKHIVKQTTDENFEIIDYNIIISASVNGLKGFVGDHFRASVNIKENDCERTVHLFIKTLPLENKPKEYFIVENQFFKREALMFTLIEEMREQEASGTCNVNFILQFFKG